MSGVFWNMLNAVVGSGLDGVPNVYKKSGLISAWVMTLFVARMSFRTTNLIVQCGSITNARTYPEIAEHAFGPSGYFLVSGVLLLFSYGKY